MPESHKLVFLVMLGIMLVFLFPAARGSFTSTRGPATAFRAGRYLREIVVRLHQRLLVLSSLVSMESSKPFDCFASTVLPAYSTVPLRC